MPEAYGQINELNKMGAKMVDCTYGYKQARSAQSWANALVGANDRDPRKVDSIVYHFWYDKVPILRRDLLAANPDSFYGACGNIAINDLREIPDDVESARKMHDESLRAERASEFPKSPTWPAEIVPTPTPPLDASKGPSILRIWMWWDVWGKHETAYRFYKNGELTYDSDSGRLRGTWRALDSDNRKFSLDAKTVAGVETTATAVVLGHGESFHIVDQSKDLFSSSLMGNQYKPLPDVPAPVDPIVGLWKEANDRFSIYLRENGEVMLLPGYAPYGVWKVEAF